MLKNIIFMSLSILLFFICIVGYGVIINLRESTLEEVMEEKKIGELEDISLMIDRKHYRMELYSGDKLVKSYKAVFGRNHQSVKTAFNDNVTPTGEYYICSIDTAYEYYRCFHLNFPNERDASEAYKNGYINKAELKLIIDAARNKMCPSPNTPLGANIGIHGMGKYNFIFKNLPFIFNWTDGSIAVSDESIDEIYSLVKIGTKVIIKN